MEKFFDNARTVVLITVVIVISAFCGVRLMKLQIVEGASYYEQSKRSTMGTQTIKAARGEIVDADGIPIVKNKVGFNVIIERAFLPNDRQEENKIILRLAKLLESGSVAYIESIPITKTRPYEFLDNRDRDISTMRDVNHLRLNVYATPTDCIDEIVKLYDISPEYSLDEQRIIAGVRYEMLLRNFSVNNRYTFAADVPMDIVAKIKELSYNLSGVDIAEEAIRVYVGGDILSNGIGTIGPIYAEEYAELKSQGYGLNDVVGKSGIEKAMEKNLRGHDGKRQITISNNVVTGVETIDEAIPGNTVKLTIDSKFQSKVQDIFEEHIRWLKEDEKTGKHKGATAGSIVVLDVKTGAVLSMVNYPTFDINDYLNDYSEVVNRPDSPLLNRAIDGLYRPGSTFKTITATSVLNENIVDGKSTVLCNKEYTFYSDIRPTCLGWHGNISVSPALQVSCNIFFYDTARRLGISKLSEYAGCYGLGQPLGLEIGGKAGYLANPDTFAKLGMPWTPGQVLQAAIGQSEIAVTPLQMAVQAATIANRGVRLKPYLVDSINSYNMDKVVEKTERRIESEIEIKNENMYELIEDGMVLAAANTPSGKWSLNTLPDKAAIKTGSPQKTATETHSSFIGYYPISDPEIAFSGMVENGEYSKYMIRSIIDAYYGYETVGQKPPVITIPNTTTPNVDTPNTTIPNVNTPNTSTTNSDITTETQNTTTSITSIPRVEAEVGER